jgi:replicative DNA helicase
MNLYIIILKYLLIYNIYNKYYKYINKDFVEKNYPELFRLYTVLPILHKSEKDVTYTLEDLKLCLHASYPKLDVGFYEILFAQLEAVTATNDSVETYLEAATKREKALVIAKTALAAAEGNSSWDDLQSALADIEVQSSTDEIAEWRQFVVTDDIVDLYEKNKLEKGLRWRLPSLNGALGELRKGNFGFVFARPETGKTTFLASELSNFAEQVDRPVLWFNNEQAGADVMERIYQASLGKSDEEIRANPQKAKEDFAKLTKGNILLYDDGSITKKRIEEVCKEVVPSLVVFDQIDNIKGFNADRNDLELKEIYQWARELCKVYCPVIGVCQAGASGEDKKWLTMNDVDNSKTAKQGTADWILGIGKVHESGQEYIRFMHLSKNKLHPEDKRMRHGKWTVLIRPEIARYQDI